MSKLLSDFIVTDNRTIENGCSFIALKRADGQPLPQLVPGQFVEVRVDHSATTYLRRPISVCDVVDDSLILFVKPVGAGSLSLTQSKISDKLSIVLPLGNGFSKADDGRRVLLVGGGVGAAPLVYLSKELTKNGVDVTVAIGGRSKSDVIGVVNCYGDKAKVVTATDDGSHGYHGLVTQMPEFQEHFDKIYACGPTPMMRAVAAIARQRGIECEVSLENHMACGIGACLCCVEKTTEGNLCVCTDGPVFNINQLLWQ